MKKRNQKTLREKEFRELQDRYNTLFVRSYRKEKVELEEPIHHGYYLEYVIKDQYLNSKIYNKLVLLLDKQHLAWCGDKSFMRKDYRGKYEKITPSFTSLNIRKYDELDDDLKPFYDIVKKFNVIGQPREIYEVNPSVVKKYFTYKRSKAYITHRYLVDSELESELSFIRRRLEYSFPNEYFDYSWYRKYDSYIERKRIRCKERKFRFEIMKGGVTDDDVFDI